MIPAVDRPPARRLSLGPLIAGLVLLSTLLLPGRAERAGAAEPTGRVLGIRSSAAAGHTRVVFDLSRPTVCTPQFLTGPDRLVLDMAATPADSLRAFSLDSDLVARVRFGAVEQDLTRFVLDLKMRVDYRLLTVPADGEKPDRLVVDLFGLPAPGRTDAPVPKSAPETPSKATPSAGAAGRTGRRGVEPAAPRIVVVDAGHGGQDPGAGAFALLEKDVCLEVATQIVRELNRRPGFKATLTRDEDVFIPLRGRIAIAEKRSADAFVSIHANASRNSGARGTEVYYLSLGGATDEASRELAREENAADARGGVAPVAEDDLSSILFDMQQTEVLHRSSLLAQSVVTSLSGWGRISARGVKQAGFVVLKSPRIPSILVETAFITNAPENRLLASATFRRDLARRVADGVVAYFTNVSVAEFRSGPEE